MKNYIVGFKIESSNDIKQERISKQMNEVLLPKSGIMLEFAKNHQIIPIFAQSYSNYDVKGTKNFEDYLAKAKFDLGYGVISSKKVELSKEDKAQGLTQIEIEDGVKYWTKKINSNMQVLNKDINDVWSKNIWTKDFHAKRAFSMDYVTYMTTDGQNFEVNFFISIK